MTPNTGMRSNNDGSVNGKSADDFPPPFALFQRTFHPTNTDEYSSVGVSNNGVHTSYRNNNSENGSEGGSSSCSSRNNNDAIHADVDDACVRQNVCDGEFVGDLTTQMGKLWWPTSNQDIQRKYERDKHGRLLYPEESANTRRGRKNGSGKATTTSTDKAANKASSTYGFVGSNGNIGLFGNRSNDKDTSKKDGGKSSVENQKEYEWYHKVVPTIYSANNLVTSNTYTISSSLFDGANPKLQTSIKLVNILDKVWAKELYEMDAKEREVVTNEIHGVQTTRMEREEETAKRSKECVIALRYHIETNLDKELDNGDSIVPPVTKDAYRRGLNELKSDYIVSDAFLLKFVMACRYDIEQAAVRYFRYLDLIYELFGDDSLTRPLALADLTKREIRYLKKGQMQLLPSRDRAGRRIYAFSGCDDWNFNIREKYRTNIYLIDVLSEDKTTQELGAVSLNAPRVRTSDSPFGFEGMTLRNGKQELLGGKCSEAQFFRKINEAVPIRFSAIHYFAPPTMIYNIGRAMILTLLGKDHRKIVRFHAGSQLECNYSLRTFGIPYEDITITDGGNIKTKNVQKFINGRRSIETFREQQQLQRKLPSKNQPNEHEETEAECKECSIGIECPEVDCIVFGDKAMNAHPANIEFRDMLRVMEREREENLNGFRVIVPVKEFIEQIIMAARSERNLRFLCFDKKTHLFVDIADHNELCKRVSQALRDQRKRSRIEEQRFVRLAETEKIEENNKGTGGANDSGATVAARYQQQRQPSFGSIRMDGGSIMGLDSTKRLKLSYNNNNNTSGSSGSFDSSCFFCTH